MIKGKVIIRNEKGIHARPSSIISLESQKFKSNITLIHDGKSTSSKDVLQIIIVVPVIDKRYPLSGVAEALRYFGEGHAKGKVVITLEHDKTYCDSEI